MSNWNSSRPHTSKPDEANLQAKNIWRHHGLLAQQLQPFQSLITASSFGLDRHEFVADILCEAMLVGNALQALTMHLEMAEVQEKGNASGTTPQ